MSSQESNDPWPTTPAETRATPAASPLPPEEWGVKPGDRLGSYELLAPLGKGGMGMVFRARHVRLKKEFALKVLSPRLACDPDAVLRFERETEALGRLEHINLVRASDAGVENGVPFVVMELLDGMDVANLAKQRGPWPIAEACEVVRQAAEGLQHAFERGLVHRDIKPSNLWLTPDGAVKLLDLGLARLCGESNAGPMTAAGTWMGTPDYVAPEQILDSHSADIRADLYSLGCTLFHLLIGEPPFGPSTHPELRHKSEAHLKEPPPSVRQRRPDVPADLAALIARLLAKRPEDRYQTPAELAAALTPFAENAHLRGLLTRTWETQSPRGPLTVGRKSYIRTLAIGIAAALLIGLPFWWWFERRPGEPNSLPPITPVDPRPVQIVKMDVMHYPTLNGRTDRSRARLLGKDVSGADLKDAVTVEGQLSRPAYAFLIAFRPDGTWDVCFPDKDNVPPPFTDKPRFPSGGEYSDYLLEEGAGLQVFTLVASSQPLPSFKDWWAHCRGCPWKKHEELPDRVWQGNGIDEVKALTAGIASGQRGKRKEGPGKSAVAELAKWLRTTPQVEAVQVLGFAVLPKDNR